MDGPVRARRQQPRQRHAAEIRHAQDAEAALDIVLGPVKRDDVGMLQPSEAEMLLAVARGDFQHDQPLGE